MTPAANGARHSGLFRSAVTWLCAAFVLTGVVNTLLGPFLPEAVRRWELSEAFAGLFFPAQFIGGMSGTLLYAWVAPRLGLNWCLSLSLFFMAAGVMTVAASSAKSALAAAACWGFGLGLNIPAANSLAARGSPGGTEARITMLNFSWGLGAAIGPSILTRAFAEWSLGGPLTALGAVLLIASLAAVKLFPREAIPCERQRCKDTEPVPLRIPLLAAGLLFFYVGTESAFSGWLALIANRVYDLSLSSAGLVLSVFWTAFIAIRGVLPALLWHMGAFACVRAGMLAFIVGALLVIAGGGQFHLIFGSVLAGCGLAPVFPLILSAFYRLSGTASSGWVSFVFACSALGGACIPPVVGAVADGSGNLRLGIAVLLVFSTAILLLHGTLMERVSGSRGAAVS